VQSLSLTISSICKVFPQSFESAARNRVDETQAAIWRLRSR
jgi:hypothetical protein